MRTHLARCEIMRQAAATPAGHADRWAALGVTVTRLAALLATAGLLIAAVD